jgi:uncharacterized protein
MSLLFLLATWQIAAVPSPLAQQGAECEHPTYATDQLVCADPELLKLDRNMMEKLAEAGFPSGPFVEPQEDWFRRSRLCAMTAQHLSCVVEAYLERMKLLEALGSKPVSTKPCGVDAAMFAETANGILLLLADGKVFGWAQARSKTWTPFLTIRTRGHRKIVTSLEGKVVARCG